MDKKYVELFKTLAQSTAVAAEQVMEYDKQKNASEEEYNAARKLRDDFESLKDKITEAGDEYIPNHMDITLLLAGTYIQISHLQDRAEALKKALAGYQTDLIPKLQSIMEEAKDNDELVKQMANEKFVIEENK